ncbi:MAG TPA: CBS domain-containing protein [Actinomycetota bacterium]|nr:CBS domain-containing protein [Actinomycetota bacterium]
MVERPHAGEPAPGLGTVADVMTRDLLVLAPDVSAAEAARELERAGVSGAPVVEGGRVVGVVTLRDLVSRVAVPLGEPAVSGPFLRVEHVLAEALAGRKVTVREAMTTAVRAVRPDAPIAEAAALMVRSGVNRLPVVDAEGRPVGIVTRDDVVAAVARLAGATRPRRPAIPPDPPTA